MELWDKGQDRVDLNLALLQPLVLPPRFSQIIASQGSGNCAPSGFKCKPLNSRWRAWLLYAARVSGVDATRGSRPDATRLFRRGQAMMSMPPELVKLGEVGWAKRGHGCCLG